MVNFTCPVAHKPEPDPVPFLSNGDINFKAHDVGWLACGFMSLVACSASFWLIFKHLTYYTCPQQQRHIVRMLFMVPIYSLVSFASYLFYEEALYYQVIRDCYEAVTITSFFLLLLQYVGDTPEEQHLVFREVKLKKWFWPLGFWKYRPDGLKFLWLMKICILQYAIFRPLCTIMTVVMQYFGIYCLESWMPWFGHIWMAAVITVSVSVAMYCVVQFYLPIQEELKPYEPVLKFLAVKAVVFLTFWQESFLSMLVVFGAIKDAEHWNAEQIVVGLSALLSCFEMVIFGFLHIRAFSYRPYRPADHTRKTKRLRAFGHVLDFRDWFRHMKQSSKWARANRKGEDFTLVDEIRARKYEHLMQALGKERNVDLQIMREQRREESMAHFWRNPAEPTTGWDEKDGTMDAGTTAAAGGRHSEKDKKNLKTLRPDGGLYTVAELQQLAKRAGGGAEDGSTHDGSRRGSDAAGGTARPKMDELRRLASVLDRENGEDEDETTEAEADGRASLLMRHELSRQAKLRQMGYHDPYPELTAFHAAAAAAAAAESHLPPLGFDPRSPDSVDSRGFAEELEEEYKARGLWPGAAGRGTYSLTGQHDVDADPRLSQKQHGKQRSWWRALRERISGSGVDEQHRGAEGRRGQDGRWVGDQLEAQQEAVEPETEAAAEADEPEDFHSAHQSEVPAAAERSYPAAAAASPRSPSTHEPVSPIGVGAGGGQGGFGFGVGVGVGAGRVPAQAAQASGGAGNSSGIAVGNIVSRVAVADAQWGPQLAAEAHQSSSSSSQRQQHQHHHHEQRHSSRTTLTRSNRHTSHRTRPSKDRDRERPRERERERGQSRDRTSSHMRRVDTGDAGVPLNSVGALSTPTASSHRDRPSRRFSELPQQQQQQQQHQFSGFMYGGGSGRGLPAPRPRASFDRYTGEPVWTDAYGRSVSRDWVAAHGGSPAAMYAHHQQQQHDPYGYYGAGAGMGGEGRAATATVRSTSPPPGPGGRSEPPGLDGGFGQVVYIDD